MMEQGKDEGTIEQGKAEGTVYSITIYLGDMHGKMEGAHRRKFTITPEFKVLCAEKVTPEGRKDYKLPLKQKDFQIMLTDVREWLFRKQTMPFSDISSEGNVVWTISPEFTAHDKKRIKRMYLFEEV